MRMSGALKIFKFLISRPKFATAYIDCLLLNTDRPRSSKMICSTQSMKGVEGYVSSFRLSGKGVELSK